MFAPETGRFLLPSLLALIAAAVLLAVGVLPVSLVYVGVVAIGFGYWAFFAAFFRDPERVAGRGIVSPADGVVKEVQREGDRWRVAVFMNVTDVHVNRFPVSGRVDAIETSGEGFRPAYVPDARHNRQRSYRLTADIGEVELIQMTGLLARRLVSYVKVGDSRSKGDRLGMIALGSRVDLLLPADRVRIAVEVGTPVRAGVTTLAWERP